MSKHAAGHHKQRTRVDSERAFNRGQRDRLRGVSYHTCPYADKELVFGWEAGWAAQNALLRQKESNARESNPN